MSCTSSKPIQGQDDVKNNNSTPLQSVEAVQRGPLERLMKIVNENANASNRVGTAEFYDEEANGICRVLGSNLDEDEQRYVGVS